jgi:hypothetical protein
VASDDQRSWGLKSAVEITCVSAELGEVTHVGGALPDGSTWQLSVQSLIEAIQGGTIYYLKFEGNAFLVNVERDRLGRVVLTVGLREPSLLMLLPRCSH